MDKKYKGFPTVFLSSCPGGPRPKTHRLDREEKVVAYLRSNFLVAACLGFLTDVVTGKIICRENPNIRADDKYIWAEELGYYIENYDLDLPPDFLSHIYSKLDE